MGDPYAEKREEFIRIDRERMGSGGTPTTLAVNASPPTGTTTTTNPPAKPVDTSTSDTQPPSGGTSSGEKKTLVEELLEAGSYEKALQEALIRREKARTALVSEQRSLAGKVQFDSKGRPSKVNLNGIWTDIDNAVYIPDDISAALGRYDNFLYEYESANDAVDLVKQMKGLFGGDSKSGAGRVIDEEKEFRDKVKFYADLAKDILSMQRTAVNTTFEGLKDTADLMGKIKDKGILVPGQQVYIPPPPSQNMWKPLADMAGLPMGVTGGPIPSSAYQNPDEYAKILGVPGYAKGTPVQNGKSAMMNKNANRFSAFINRRNRR
jgi:hypothetical protein